MLNTHWARWKAISFSLSLYVAMHAGLSTDIAKSRVGDHVDRYDDVSFKQTDERKQYWRVIS